MFEKIRPGIWLCFLLLGLTFIVYASTPVAAETPQASEIEEFIDSDRFRSAPFDERLRLLDARLAQLPPDIDSKIWARIAYHRLNAMARFGDLEGARAYLDDINERFFAVAETTDFYVDALYPAGFIYVYTGDVEAALSTVERMKDAAGFDDNPLYQQYADNVLVALYTNIGNASLAARVLINSYESGKSENYTRLEQLKLLANIGFALVNGDDFEEAERYLSIGRQALARAAGDGVLTDSESIQVSWHLNENLANLYIQQERYEELESIIPELVDGAEFLGSPLLDLRTDLVTAASFYGRGDARAAEKLLLKIAAQSDDIGSIDLKIAYYELYAKVLTMRGRHVAALAAYRTGRDVEKSTSSKQLRARAEFMEAQLNLQKQNHEIERLESETQAVRMIQKRERYILALTLIGLVVTTVFASLLFVSKKRLGRTAADLAISEQKAQSAANAKAVFLANMSHEIRTPLNGLMGMAQILATRTLGAKDRECIDVIVSSGEVLLAVVNDVLDISKIEAGKMVIDRVPTKIAANIDQLIQLWRVKGAEKGIRLNYMIDQNVPDTLLIDPVRLRQCVSNLMSNAIKFTEEGEVAIKVSYLTRGSNLATGRENDGDGVLSIEIRDTGIGVKPEALDRLFTAFEQADSSTTRKFGGTGLGLAITAELCTLMGGEISVQSEQGVGSTFTITLLAPRAAAIPPTDAIILPTPAPTLEPGPGALDAPPPTPQKIAGRVLIVDDNQVNRMVAKAFIEECAAESVEAVDGADALKRLAAQRFDLVLLDMHMPVMDGPATIKAVRESSEPWRDIPIITLTADAMAGDRERYLNLGTDGYIAKPLVKDGLLSEIHRVMQKKTRRAHQAA